MQTGWLKFLIVLGCIFSIVGISYALTQVTISNTSTINAGQNIFITQPVTSTLANPSPPTTCPGDKDPSYTQSVQSLFWNLTAGAPGENYYFCIDNQGSAPDSVNISSDLTQGQCPATGNTLVFGPVIAQTSLAGHTATTAPVDVQVCAGGAMAPTATGPTFHITVK